jgi:phosphoribosylformimino-5-aminoimidazole carboxamide ribotide isomerase
MAKTPFQVIPVLDLLNGQAVHAVGGRRAHYQPIQSVLHPSSDAVALARAIQHTLGSRTLYLADLDAIAGSPPRVDIYRAMIDSGIHIWVDAGLSSVESAAPLLEFEPSALTLIAGLETLTGPRALAALLDRAGTERVIFSMDLFEGTPRTAPGAAWRTEDPRELAEAAIEYGVRRLIILDLARVGTSQGLGTQKLMTRIRHDHPSVAVILGGGISRVEEIVDIRSAGVAAVLVGSAIHDGRIGARELETHCP